MTIQLASPVHQHAVPVDESVQRSVAAPQVKRLSQDKLTQLVLQW